MLRSLRRLLTVVWLLAGCSSANLLSRHESRDRQSVDETFAAQRESNRDAVGNDRPPQGRLASATRKRAGSEIAAPRLERRREIAEALSAGVKHDREGNVAAAQADYRRVLELDPQHPFAHYQLAVAADNEGRFEEAEEHYLILLDQTPENPDLLASMGWSYLLQGRYAESERRLRDAIEIDPQHRTALYNLGWLYGTLGHDDEALAILRSGGSEDEAQQALAEVRSQRASNQMADATRPPIVAPASGSAARPQKGLPPDALAAARPPGASGTSPRKVGTAADPLEQMFARLDEHPGRGSAAPVVGAGLASAEPKPLPTDGSGLPLIRPRGTRAAAADTLAALGDSSAVRDASLWTVEKGPAGAAAAQSVPPDWPYRSAASGNSAGASPPSARALAAQWGLFVGPGGLLFPPVDGISPSP